MNTRHFIFTAAERLKGRKTLLCLREMLKHDSYKREELENYRNEKLKDLLEDSVQNVPFYSQFGKLPIPKYPDEVLDVIKKWPIIRRQHFQENAKLFISRKVKKSSVYKARTGGSTGEPVYTYKHPHLDEMGRASKIRARKWYGVSNVPRIFMIWGSSGSFDSTFKGKIQTLAREVRYSLNGIKRVSAYGLDGRNIKRCVEELKQFQPELIYSYTTPIYLVAAYLVENDTKLLNPNLKLVNTTAEPLHEFQRKTIEKAFGVPVQNGYGAAEVTNIAFSCPSGGMHVVEDNVFVELLNDNNERDVFGRVLVTALHSIGAPIIRYEIGDIAAWRNGYCSCSLPYKMLEKIEGRVHDLIKLGSGKIIHGELFTHAFEHINGLRKFQVIQRDKNKFDIIFQTVDGTHIEYNRQINKLQKEIGEPVELNVQFVDHIETDPSAKFRWVRSDVNSCLG